MSTSSGQMAIVTGQRSIRPVDAAGKRRLCRCQQEVTHAGAVDGEVVMDGCIWCVRRWVRGGGTSR